MNQLRAVLFKKPAIYWNHQKVVFPFAKMEALLYYLLVAGEATREKLAVLLWGEMEDNAAKRNLRNTLYLLKKLLSADLLITSSRSKVGLNLKMVAASGLELLTIKDIAKFLEKNEGEFLEGFSCKDAYSFEEWVLEKREQFRKESIRYLTKHIIILMNQKEYSCAKKYLKRLIEIDEYNESAYRALMKIYAQEDSYKVTEIYRQLERKMEKDLGLIPSVKTQEVYNKIKEKKSSRVVQEDISGSPKFFGRKKELELLRQWLNEFYHTHHTKQMILLQGDHGVGKSAIVEELFSTISIEKNNVFRTQCYQAEMEYVYKAWNNIFSQVMMVLMQAGIHLPPLWRQVIACVFPTAKINKKLLNEEMMMDTDHFSSAMVEEIICEVFGRAGNLKKTILLIEDIHWMDKQGWLLLWQLLREHGRNIVCIATCHTEYLQQIDKNTGEFERNNMLDYLQIGRFSKQDVEDLTTLRIPTIDRDMKNRLYDYTGGNALFLIEFLNLIAAGKDIGYGSIKLNSILKERIGNVSENAKKTLEIASVFFNNVHYEIVLAVSAINEFEVVEALEELQQKQLLMEDLDSDQNGFIYKFYNLQIRNYVYNQMSMIRQKMLHRRTALYLEHQLQCGMHSKDIYEHILYHYTNADEKIKILEYSIRLAENYFCPQYEMFPELNHYYPTGYLDFRESRSQITVHLKKIKILLEDLMDKKSVDERLDIYKAAFWEMAGRYHIWRGEHLTGLRLIHQMLRLASAKKFKDYQVKGYQQIIYCGIQTRKAHVIGKFASKLLQLSDHDEIPDKKATALRFLGIACALKGQYQQAESYYRQSLLFFKKLAARNSFYAFTIAAAQNYIGDLRRESSAYKAALHHYEQAVRIAGRKKISEGVALFYINAGYTAFQLHDDVKAVAYLTDALKVAEGFGEQKGYWCLRGYCTLHCVLSLISLRQDRFCAAKEHLEQAKDFLKKYNDQYQTGLILRTQAEIKLLMKDNNDIASLFAEDLPLPAKEYFEQARRIFAKLQRTDELEGLSQLMTGTYPKVTTEKADCKF